MPFVAFSLRKVRIFRGLRRIISSTLTNHMQVDIRYPSWCLFKVNSAFVYCLVFAFDIIQNQPKKVIVLLM